MSTTFKGRVIQIGQVQSGTSAKGDWTKQDFTLEFGSTQHPESMTITAFPSDKIKDLTIGTDAECFVNFRSKEYKGKWYNGIDLWKVEVKSNGDKPKEATQQPQQPERSRGQFDDDATGLPF